MNNNNMDKLEKVIKGKNIKHMLDAFFNKYIRKHFNEVNSIDFIISDLGERMDDGGRNIKILRNDNPVRTNNPDWFPPKAQQTDHICTFLKQLMDNELGTKDSYVGLKVEVVTETKTYTWDVKAVVYYENSGTVILRTDPRQGIIIECPAIVRLYIYPLLTSKAVSSIIYNSIVTSESKYNFILGERNIHKGEDNVWIFGKNNLSGETNHNSLINGYNNDVDSYGNIVIGDSNKHRSLLGATIGRYIKNFKQNSFLFGTGHDNSNGPSHEVIFGKYSKIEEDTVFAIGDGEDENNRHNLFEIKAGGPILDKDGNDIRNGGGQHVQSDWNETDNRLPAYIKNKPTIPAEQVNADWNSTTGKAKILNKPNLDVYPDSAIWDTNTKKIIFKHNNTILQNMTIDGTDFIKDGMIDEVKIENDNLVIIFNTDAGKQNISLPLSEIFNPDNYYNKNEINNLFVKKVIGKDLSSNDFTNDHKNKLENLDLSKYYYSINRIHRGRCLVSEKENKPYLTNIILREFGVWPQEYVDLPLPSPGYCSLVGSPVAVFGYYSNMSNSYSYPSGYHIFGRLTGFEIQIGDSIINLRNGYYKTIEYSRFSCNRDNDHYVLQYRAFVEALDGDNNTFIGIINLAFDVTVDLSTDYYNVVSLNSVISNKRAYINSRYYDNIRIV